MSAPYGYCEQPLAGRSLSCMSDTDCAALGLGRCDPSGVLMAIGALVVAAVVLFAIGSAIGSLWSRMGPG